MPKPNLVLVTLDDLVERDLTPERAPNFADLVAAGRRFTNAYGMPVCSQSRACLLFGRYGRELGIVEAMGTETGPEPAADTPTLAALLAAEGYATALVGKFHLGRNPVAPELGVSGAPLARGYSTWAAGSPDNLASYTNWDRWDQDEDGYTNDPHHPVYAPLAQLDAAAAWWHAMAHPRFLHLALNLPHGPFHNPPAFMTAGYVPDSSLPIDRQRYERMIRAADWCLGQLRTWQGMATSTVVCVVSDNGTPSNAAGPGQDEARLKTTTFEGGVHLPMVWYGPAALVVPGTDDLLAHLVDVPATLLGLACAGVELTGEDLRPRLLGQDLPRSETVVCEAELADGTLEQAVVAERDVWPEGRELWKLRRDGTTGALELYNLTTDPDEILPIDQEAVPTLFAELQAVLDAYPPAPPA